METKRQTLVNLIFCVFLAIIFEGVLRKWIFPGQQQLLFFVRDPFVILVYLYALHAGLKPTTGIVFYTTMIFTFLVTVFSFFQTVQTQLPWWIIAYSWRTHFLMLPLAPLMGTYLKLPDLKRFFRFSLLLTPVYTFVVYFQSISPRDHWINAGRRGFFQPLPSEEGIIRTEGFFTSSIGNSIFAAMLVAALLAFWLKNDWSDMLGKYEKFIFSLLPVAIIVMSGQRGTFILCGLVVIIGFFASMAISRSMFIKVLKTSGIAISIATLLLFFVFPQHLAAIKGRFVGASKSSEIIGMDLIERIYIDLSSFHQFHDRIPAIGKGLGYSSNAAYVYNITAVDVVSENEWGRHIIELGPFFGLLTIGFRVFLSLYLFALALAKAMTGKDPAPLMFFAVLGSFLLIGQLTGNGIASGFIWFLTGVVLALLKVESPVEPVPEKV